MFTIIQPRSSGKAKKILELARENQAAILTQDKRAFEVKAKSYGFSDITVLDYEDLENDSYSLDKPVIVHNGDKFLTYVLDRYYGLTPIGFSATEEV